MNSEISAALFGLVGVALGALVTFATTVYVERRQMKAALAAAKREDARKAKVAARLVFMDIAQIQSRLRRALREGGTWSPRFALPLEAWMAYREVLALHLALGDWDDLARFFQTAARLEAQAEGARAWTKQDRPDLSDFRREQATLGAARADKATRVIERFLEDGIEKESWDDFASEEDLATEGEPLEVETRSRVRQT